MNVSQSIYKESCCSGCDKKEASQAKSALQKPEFQVVIEVAFEVNRAKSSDTGGAKRVSSRAAVSKCCFFPGSTKCTPEC